MIQSRWVGVILSSLIIGVCCSQTAVALQDFGIQAEIEGTTRISLDLLSQPNTVEKETWLNWSLHLTVLEWSPDWNDTQDHPELRMSAKADDVDFVEYNNVSFGLNRTAGGFGMSIKLIGHLAVFTWFDLGNLSGVTTQTLIVGVKFADDMPSTSYTLDIHIYDPTATTTTESSTTTITETTTGEETTGTDGQVTGLLEYTALLSVGAVVVVVIVILLKRKSS